MTITDPQQAVRALLTEAPPADDVVRRGRDRLLALATDTVSAALRCEAAARVVVITDDEVAALIAVLGSAGGGSGEVGQREVSRWGLPVDKLRYSIFSWQKLTLVQRTHMRRDWRN